MANPLKNGILQGHRAVITGASSGIGEEYARQLAAMGADLVIAARRLDRLETLARELRQTAKVRIDCFQVDLAQPDAAHSLYEKAIEGGKVTILINNAGLGKYGSFLDFPVQDHRLTLQVNVLAATELTHLFAKQMLVHGEPSYITQVASIAAFQPVGFFTVYSGSKGYVRAFSETLAFELKDTQVRVMCLCPGGTYTEFFEQSGQKITSSGHATMMTSKEVVQSAIQAMFNGQRVYVPGFLNKLACFFPRLLPRNFALNLAFKAMNRAVERVPVEAKTENPGLN